MCPSLSQLLERIANESDAEKGYLLGRGIVAKLVDILLGKDSPHPEVNGGKPVKQPDSKDGAGAGAGSAVDSSDAADDVGSSGLGMGPHLPMVVGFNPLRRNRRGAYPGGGAVSSSSYMKDDNSALFSLLSTLVRRLRCACECAGILMTSPWLCHSTGAGLQDAPWLCRIPACQLARRCHVGCGSHHADTPSLCWCRWSRWSTAG